jgi:hypothetical protein
MQIIQELYDTLTEKLGYDKIKWDLFKDSLNSNLRVTIQHGIMPLVEE